MNNEDKYKELETLILTKNKNKNYVARINKELKIIKEKDSAYFFITAYNIINEIKSKGIIIGPAYGCSNNSLINYLLEFTTVNPIKYNLMLEPYYFSKYHPYLTINVSNKKKIPKKYLNQIKGTNFEIHELEILKLYQNKSIEVDYKFYPKKLKEKRFDFNFGKDEFLFSDWVQGFEAITLNNENDLINSMALSSCGLKEFHFLKMLHDKNILFQGLNETGELMIFQEQWIKFVAECTRKENSDIYILKHNVAKRILSLKEFEKLFSRGFNRETIYYFYEVLYFLPTKAHAIAKMQILCLWLNTLSLN